MPINCLVVEDEPAAQDILRKYIADCPWLNLVDVCKNALAASEVMNRSEIQLLFLDINMPGLSGMSFYKSLANPPFVIFTTAYPEFAVEGFEVNAVDFLLKPFPFDRFLKAVNKATDSINSQNSSSGNAAYAFVLLKSEKKLHRVRVNEIVHIEAIGDYVNVHLRRGGLIVHETFKGLLDQLPSGYMSRIHKSHAIAVDKIEFIEGNRVRVRDKFVPIGQAFRNEFMQTLKSKNE
ncbi:MAG: response regulator transcription factor [Deferribacteres bacterium]|nr:response regulator transcription factor [candidate division KSB1 bacterium]MCB9504107.1 response regulator transcription factor [Deferribacteres bacterium]